MQRQKMHLYRLCQRAGRVGAFQRLDYALAQQLLTDVIRLPTLEVRLALGQWPLLRALRFEQGVVHTGDVQVAPAGGCAVFVPNGFGAGVGEQRGP